MALRVGHLSTFYHTAILLMADAGTEERLGTRISWRLFGTGPDIVNAFGRGELDLAYIGLPPAIIGIDRGIRVKCVAGGHVEGTVIAGEGSLAVYPALEGLGEILGQLRGGTIGVPGRGSIHDVIITECLERLGLKGEVEIRNFPWSDLVTEAMARGEVIAVAGTPALAAAVERYAGGKILYPPSMLWPNNPSYGIVTSEEFLGWGQKQVEGFLALHEQTALYLRANPGEAAARISEYVKVADRDLVLRAIQISPRYCAQLSGEYVSSTMGLVRALGRLGYISRALSEEEIFEPSIIRKVHPRGSHY